MQNLLTRSFTINVERACKALLTKFNASPDLVEATLNFRITVLTPFKLLEMLLPKPLGIMIIMLIFRLVNASAG